LHEQSKLYQSHLLHEQSKLYQSHLLHERSLDCTFFLFLL
jgi:hypothetical protein